MAICRFCGTNNDEMDTKYCSGCGELLFKSNVHNYSTKNAHLVLITMVLGGIIIFGFLIGNILSINTNDQVYDMHNIETPLTDPEYCNAWSAEDPDYMYSGQAEITFSELKLSTYEVMDISERSSLDYYYSQTERREQDIHGYYEYTFPYSWQNESYMLKIDITIDMPNHYIFFNFTNTDNTTDDMWAWGYGDYTMELYYDFIVSSPMYVGMSIWECTTGPTVE